MQRPQTTILNLIDFARDIGLVESLLSPEITRAVHASNRALYDDGRLTPDAVRTLDWREREWYFDGAISVGANVGPAKIVPQGGIVRLLTFAAKTPPSSTPATFVFRVGGQAETISLQPGTASVAVSVAVPVAPGDVMTLSCTSTGGAKGVTITAFLETGGQ